MAVGSDGLVVTKQGYDVSNGFAWRETLVDCSENDGVVTVTINRFGDLSKPVALTLRTLDDTASDGKDFQGGEITVSFAPGETSRNVKIPIVDDSYVEWRRLLDHLDTGDPLLRTESFFLALAFLPEGYAILGAEECIISIMDDDVSTASSWGVEHFSAEELLNPNIGADLAEPDRDGTSNLLEYALGWNPRSDDSGNSYRPSLEVIESEDLLGRPTYLDGFTFIADRSKSDIVYIVQESHDMITWKDLYQFDPVKPMFTYYQSRFSPIDGNRYKVSAWSQAQDSERIFYRLLIRKR